MPELPEITEAKVVRILPGDTLVLKVDRVLSSEQWNDIWETVQHAFNLPDGAKVAILEDGIEIEILRKEESKPTIQPEVKP